SRSRIDAELNRKFCNNATPLKHKDVRDIKFYGYLTNAQPVSQFAENPLLRFLQSMHQKGENIPPGDRRQEALVEFQTVAPMVPFIAVVWKRGLRPAALEGVQAAPGISEIVEMESRSE